MVKSKIDENNWIRCGRCGHKLGKIVGVGSCDPAPAIEMKCHSCKELNVWHYDYLRSKKEA